MKQNVAIIGAGVIGLTTALEAQSFGFNVTIYADKKPMESTSVKAGACFEPYKPGNISIEDMRYYLKIGLKKYKEIIASHKESETGIRLHQLYAASTKLINPKDVAFLPEFPKWKLVKYPKVPGGYKSAILIEDDPMIDPTLALPFLTKKLKKNGGIIKILKNKITNLKDFIEQTPETIIFNCSGLGARDLIGDKEIMPMRGQIIVTKYKHKENWSVLGDDGYYVFPRYSATILGGTTELGEEKEVTTKKALAEILRKAKKVIPDLKDKDIVRTYAGIRPYRVSGARVELQKIGKKKHILSVGFGGSGWTFCWGAAKRAVGLAIG